MNIYTLTTQRLNMSLRQPEQFSLEMLDESLCSSAGVNYV